MVNPFGHGPQAISLDYGIQLATEGRRLMDHFQAMDNSSVDFHKQPNDVYVQHQGPLGLDYMIGKFSGDKYHGTLETNNDERQVYIDRKYEFSDQGVVITQQRPTFGAPRYDVYRIDEINQQASVEHFA